MLESFQARCLCDSCGEPFCGPKNETCCSSCSYYKQNHFKELAKKLKPKFYYFRTEDGTPIITVCVLSADLEHPISRGVSFCSVSEMPRRKEGQNKAKGRAISALKHKTKELPVNFESFHMANLLYEFPVLEHPMLGNFHEIKERYRFKSEYLEG